MFMSFVVTEAVPESGKLALKIGKYRSYGRTIFLPYDSTAAVIFLYMAKKKKKNSTYICAIYLFIF